MTPTIYVVHQKILDFRYKTTRHYGDADGSQKQTTKYYGESPSTLPLSHFVSQPASPPFRSDFRASEVKNNPRDRQRQRQKWDNSKVLGESAVL